MRTISPGVPVLFLNCGRLNTRGDGSGKPGRPNMSPYPSRCTRNNRFEGRTVPKGLNAELSDHHERALFSGRAHKEGFPRGHAFGLQEALKDLLMVRRKRQSEV